MKENRNALPTGTVLNSRYEIRRFIGGGGFGLVYSAKDSQSGQLFAIKELFPGNLVVREGESVRLASESESTAYGQVLRQFRKEGKHLVDLGRHEGIVGRHDYFEGNNTGYLVMDYVVGKPLRDLMELRKGKGESFTQAEIMDLLGPLLDGLGHVHRSGLAHLDIKPDNILLRREDKRPVLLDFGAARNTAGHSTGSSLLMGTPPYAPFEQEQKRGDRGPWSDIYALGIMLYEMAFGDERDSIPESKDRVLKDTLRPAASRIEDSKCDRRLLGLIDRCVKMEIKDRPQNVDELKRLLDREPPTMRTFRPPSFMRSPAAGWAAALMVALLWAGMSHWPEFLDRFSGGSVAPASAPVGDLMEAARLGDTDTARLLIDAGADVNARDNNGWTALMSAVWEGHTDTARLLIRADADVNASRDNGWTALIHAAYKGHTDIARLLIDAGTNVNARNRFRWTALMIAVDKGHTDIARLLIDAGARERMMWLKN